MEPYTVIILNIGTDRSEQTVQTQIRLLLMEQSDQGLPCLLFCLHLLNTNCTVKSNCSNCRTIMVIISGVPIFRIFTVPANWTFQYWYYFTFIKDGRPYLFHRFRNKYFNKISLGNMLYFQNKLKKF